MTEKVAEALPGKNPVGPGDGVTLTPPGLSEKLSGLALGMVRTERSVLDEVSTMLLSPEGTDPGE